jgi:uncharacterized RDD family membrane protein YckC
LSDAQPSTESANQADLDIQTPLLRTPSLRKRMACWLYEGMLLFGVIFIAGYLFGTLSQTKHALHNRHGLQAFLFLVFAIYFTWLWSKGQTLAMKTWHIQILDKDGHPVSQARALLRYFLSWVWFFAAHGHRLAIQLASSRGGFLGICLDYCLGTFKPLPIP